MKVNTYTIREEFKISLDEGGGRCADFMSRLFCFNIFFLFSSCVITRLYPKSCDDINNLGKTVPNLHLTFYFIFFLFFKF